jgi:negative regulator of sigma E activity
MISKAVLYDYADGLLDAATAKAVEEALLKDELLQSQWTEIQTFKALLSSDSLATPNIGFSQNLIAAWTTEQATIPSRTLPAFKANYKPLQVIASLFFLLFIGLCYMVMPTATVNTPSLTIPDWFLNPNWNYAPLYWSMLLGISIVGVFFLERILLFWIWKKRMVSI